MASKSSTQRSGVRGRVLDQAAREKRVIEQLRRLEMDNYHELSEASEEEEEEFLDQSYGKKKMKKRKGKSWMRQAGKYKKNFTALLEEELEKCPPGQPNYVTQVVPPPKYPPRHFCSVCGLLSNYTCVQCGARFCSVRCDGIHKDTRCLKYCV